MPELGLRPRAYLEVAELVLGEKERDEYLNVAAGLAVLAEIAASDSICCARLRSRYRGEDHRGAAELLRTATPDGTSLARSLLRLLDLKHISVFHASLGTAVQRARDAGDRQSEALAAGLLAEVDQFLRDANSAALAYIQREAGYVRTGSHVTRADGEESGQWREADLVVASWYQHTSRDGEAHDPHRRTALIHARPPQAHQPQGARALPGRRRCGVVARPLLESQQLPDSFGLPSHESSAIHKGDLFGRRSVN